MAQHGPGAPQASAPGEGWILPLRGSADPQNHHVSASCMDPRGRVSGREPGALGADPSSRVFWGKWGHLAFEAVPGVPDKEETQRHSQENRGGGPWESVLKEHHSHQRLFEYFLSQKSSSTFSCVSCRDSPYGGFSFALGDLPAPGNRFWGVRFEP